MRQVLEVLSSLITLNPDKTVSSKIKIEILGRLLSIITHQSSQPLVKPTFKVLECFLSNNTVSLTELMHAYEGGIFTKELAIVQSQPRSVCDSKLKDSFISAVFEWMSQPETAPAAGKLLVTLFQKLRVESMETTLPGDENYSILWQRWTHHGLARHPDSLENIKNYLFPPLFKLDRTGSIEFLRYLAKRGIIESFDNSELDAQAFLLLSAMEVGKKCGLVDESSKNQEQFRL